MLYVSDAQSVHRIRPNHYLLVDISENDYFIGIQHIFYGKRTCYINELSCGQMEKSGILARCQQPNTDQYGAKSVLSYRVLILYNAL